MRVSARLVSLLAALALVSLAPSRVAAFCGFYVAGSETTLHNHATTVVLMREGNRTVLSMQNDYAGPPEDFAMVVPVPVVLQRTDVRTLDRSLFERIERLTGPRLVEYWEQDPCVDPNIGLGGLGTIGFGGGGSGSGYGSGAGGGSFVRVEAQFAVGEYDIVVLGTNDSSALDTWLRAHRYHIPEGAAEALRPYVEAGMKFFVARVDVDRVRFERGRAVLSPLRVHYDSPELSLPVRLGLLNSSGAQDLVVVVLARQQRFEVANYPNAFMPTNLDVSDDVRDQFGAFYETLLTRTFERHPGAVVTEYAWQATTCDPCPPDATLDNVMLTSLGGDVLFRDGVQPGGGWGFRGGGVVPRVLTVPATVDGDLSPEVVHRVVRRHINELRFCYEQDLAQNPSASGRVDLSFVIAPTGAVSEASAAADELATVSARVSTCMQSAVRRWTFPAPEDGHEARVTQQVVCRGPTGAPSTDSSAPPTAPSASETEFVATRLHYRYERGGLGEDLVFRAAPAVIGGREVQNDQGALEEGASPAPENNFQSRYAIRHAWEGEIACEHPTRGRWGGRPGGQDDQAFGIGAGMGTGIAVPSVAPAHAPPIAEGETRAPIALESVVYTPAPDLGLVGRDASTDAPGPAPTTEPEAAPPTEAPPAAAPPPAETSSGLCAARSMRGDAGAGALFVLASLALAARRRRR
ncbi:MAG: DUF2330 domain-containing protein [Deltaproteobacteria bacterium]|nr:DUF2330 domain-containing protein [Deltaproteobacteria bacterium]